MPRSMLVSYDLRGRDETSADYADLIKEIKAYGTYAKLMLSTWIVVTDWTASQVYNDLWPHMDANDRLFVCPLDKPASWINLMATDEWMRDRP